MAKSVLTGAVWPQQPQNCFVAGSASRLGPLAVSRGKDGARELELGQLTRGRAAHGTRDRGTWTHTSLGRILSPV